MFQISKRERCFLRIFFSSAYRQNIILKHILSPLQIIGRLFALQTACNTFREILGKTLALGLSIVTDQNNKN